MNKRLSFAWLLTIIYLGCMIPLILLMGALVYTEYRYFLINNHTNTMHDLVHAVADPQGAEQSVEQTVALSRLTDVLVEQLRGSDFEVVVLDESGQRLSPSIGAGPWLDAETHVAASTRPTAETYTVDTPTGQRVVYLLPVYAADNQVIGTIESSFATQTVLTDMRQLVYWLILTVLGMIVLALLMGPLLAQLAMRPLRGLVATANHVGRGNLSERAPLSKVNEFHNLAATFNTMLDHIQATMDRQQQTAITMRRFVADVSHELRSPLNVLSGSVEVLEVAQQHGDQEGCHQATAILRSEVESMGRLVNDLLLLARMESVHEQQGAALQLTQIEPLPLLEEITERARLLATEQQVRMEWPQTDPGSLLADASAVRRALNNLVENALHHTPADKSIVLSLQPEPDGCWFIVSDEGCGIKAEHIPHLCERFYRIDSARTRKGGSSGLGLAIVHAIVTAHNGRIAIKSALGFGTIVRIWLPHNGPHMNSQNATETLLSATTYETLVLPETSETSVLRHNGTWKRHILSFIVGILFIVIFSGGVLTFTSYAQPELFAPRSDQLTVAVDEQSEVNGVSSQVVHSQNEAPTSSTFRFDEAIQFASEQVDQTIPVEVWHDYGTNDYEVTFSDRADVYIDIENRQVIEIDVPAPTGQSVGTERQQTERARVVAAIVQGLIELSFDEAAIIASEAHEGKFIPEEIELRWHRQQERVIYVVESTDEQEVVVDPRTGEILEIVYEDSDDDDN